MATRVVTALKKKRPQNGMEEMVYERQAQICKAFANSVRLKILDQVSRGECSASTLQDTVRISKANLSQHISILKSAGIISTRRDGKHLYYTLTIPEVKEACQLIRKVLYAQVEADRKMLR